MHPMKRPIAEIKGWLNIAADYLSERWRTKVQGSRIWIKTWTGSAYSAQEFSCEPKLRNVLVLVKLAESLSEADRMLKAKAIQVRPWDCSSPWTEAKYGDALRPGEPMLIRRGKKYFGVHTVMVPLPTQTLRFWRQELCA